MRCKKYMNMIMAKNFPRKIQDYKPESKKSQRTPIKINTKAHTHKQTYMGISQTNCRKTKIKISKTEKKINTTHKQQRLKFSSENYTSQKTILNIIPFRYWKKKKKELNTEFYNHQKKCFLIEGRQNFLQIKRENSLPSDTRNVKGNSLGSSENYQVKIWTYQKEMKSTGKRR